MAVMRKTMTFDMILSLLNGPLPFSMTRYGDGEWACILGEEGGNCDKCAYLPELRDGLIKTLKYYKPYYHCLLTVATANKPELVNYLVDHSIKVDWYNGDALLDASVAGKLLPFINILRQKDKKVVYVGPAKLLKLKSYFDIAKFVVIPERDCILEKQDIKDSVMEVCNTMSPNIILFSAGMATNVIVDELYTKIGGKVTMIDVGSLFDIYCGVVSRSYAKGKQWEGLIKQNMGIK